MRIFLLLVCLMLFFTACGVQNQASVTGTETIEDSVGRKVTLPDQRDSIACMYAYITHMSAMLGDVKKISATVPGVKRDVLFTYIFPEILDIPVTFNSGIINIEELMKINPEVVLVRLNTAYNEAEMEKLQTAGMITVVSDYVNMEQQYESAEIIGTVFGAEAKEKARLYKEFYLKCINMGRELTKSLKEEDKIRVYHAVMEATRTDTKGDLCAEIIEAAGLNNVSVGEELNLLENKTYASVEQIYLWNPEYLICNEVGVPNYFLTDEKFAGLPAVLEKKVVQMPVGISRWGHPGSFESPLAILWLGKTFYPELFKNVDLEAETRYFYKTFFNLDLTDEQITGILTADNMRLLKEDI